MRLETTLDMMADTTVGDHIDDCSHEKWDFRRFVGLRTTEEEEVTTKRVRFPCGLSTKHVFADEYLLESLATDNLWQKWDIDSRTETISFYDMEVVIGSRERATVMSRTRRYTL